MTGSYLLSGGTVLTAEGPVQADVLVQDGKVASIGFAGSVEAETIDCAGLTIGPGFVDLHAHLREPGQEWKEDIESGSAAAVAGGYTAIVAMPNTAPPTDAGHLARYVADRGRKVALCEVVPAGCITAGMQGERLAHLDELAAAGVTMFTDDGVTVMDAGLLRRAMDYLAGRGGLVAQHAEDPGLSRDGQMHEGAVSSWLGMSGLPAAAESTIVARDLALVRLTGCRYHVQHVSAAETVALIASAKDEGLPVTAEVAPHHLSFDDERVRTGDSVYKMYPPLRADSDIAALRDGLENGVIDAVATDHAPHAAHEKDVPFEEAPRGVIGLETAFGAVRTFTGLEIVGVFDRMSIRPARIAGLENQGRWPAEGSPANLAVVDPDAAWSPSSFESKSKNSPFIGTELTGSVRYTMFNGDLVLRDGKVDR
jgi:dihydroorotase